MYIAGLNLQLHNFPIGHNKGMEGIVLLSLFGTLVRTLRMQAATIVKANKEGGAIRTLPNTLTGLLVTPIHALGMALPPLVYFLSVAANGFEQPQWMEPLNFPMEADLAVGVGGKAALRTLASVAFFATTGLMDTIMKHLDTQFHYIGVREKSKVVSTGPYAYVRHPLYSLALAHQLLLSVCFWSYAPLISCGIVGAAFAFKMPIEEQLLENDANIGPAYTDYKKRVPARIIPYIW